MTQSHQFSIGGIQKTFSDCQWGIGLQKLPRPARAATAHPAQHRHTPVPVRRRNGAPQAIQPFIFSTDWRQLTGAALAVPLAGAASMDRLSHPRALTETALHN